MRDERSRVIRRGDAGTEVVIQLLSPVTGLVEIDLTPENTTIAS